MKQQSVNRRTFIKRSGLIAILMLASPVCADDAARLAALLAPAIEQGGLVTIPPGDYELDGAKPLPLASHMTVSAYGARFHLPKTLGDKARAVVFAGENVSDFRWLGGHFTGHVFDPAKADNTWEPNANTRAILITTSPGGQTENLTFRDVTSEGLAGAAITVLGAEKKGSEREVETLARSVTVENCRLERTGKCMWDYGLLWQITVWPEDYTPRERAMAAKYFRNDLIRGPVRMESGDDRVFFENTKPLPLTKTDHGGRETVCFFGDALPTNIVRGKQYFVIESTPQFIRIAVKPGGEAIRFAGSAGPQARLISDLFSAHLALYAPTGSGPGKGALDLVACSNVVVRGCTLSALGDTMHIQKSRDILFANNRITGSRMGAFFLAEYCKNAVVVSNTVDGSNGSRVMSIEKSAENVTIMGNTFCNGGRGSWINQPRNLLMQGNIFSNNTTKCERDPHRGRRSFVTGDYESYAEMYFTTYEAGGRYGDVILRENVFTTGPEAAHVITFAPGGHTLLVERNIFSGPVRSIPAATGCTNVTLRDNVGMEQSLAVGGQLASAAECAPAFHLNSKSRWTIEYGGATKPEVLRFAAEQLDAHLSRMLGETARPSLAERNWADGGYHIRLVAGGITPPLAVATPRMATGADEFRIETAPEVIDVTASNPASLLFAVYSLLETQGCHWLYPGAQGEVIPRKAELVFPVGQHGRRADLAMRGLFPVENLQRYTESEIRELLDWMAKNGFNHLCAIQNYGWKRLGPTIRREAAKRDIQVVGYLWSFERLLPLELGKEHPEYFAFTKGQRHVDYNIKRCASSKEAIALFVKNGVAFLRDSELCQWLISPNDGAHWCQCEGCKKLLPKEQWAAFFGPLAQAVARELPSIRLQNFIYHNRYDLPADAAPYASPAMDHYFDVYPRHKWFALRDTEGPPGKSELPFDPRAVKLSNNAYLADRLAAWKSVAKGRIWLFENLMLHGTYSLPVPNLHLIAGDLRAAAKEGLDGYLFEAYAQGWNSFASDFWALGRLCWDTSLDADRLQQEYFELLLGSQSSALGAFYREYPRRIAQEMRGVATGGGPYGEMHWMHRMPQAAEAYTAAIRSISSDGLSPAGQEWLLRQRQVVDIMDEIRHRSANPPVGILGTSNPDDILFLCEKALSATWGVDGIYFARWQLAGLFRKMYAGGQAEGCALPDSFDAETRALFCDGKIWDTLAAWEDAGRFPRDPEEPDRQIREILLRAIRQARADMRSNRSIQQ